MRGEGWGRGGAVQLPLDEELDVVESHGPRRRLVLGIGIGIVIVALAITMCAEGDGGVDVAEGVELLEGLLAGFG